MGKIKRDKKAYLNVQKEYSSTMIYNNFRQNNVFWKNEIE